MQHACMQYTVKQQITMFFRNRRRRSGQSNVKPLLKTEKANLVKIIAAKPAEAVPVRETVVVDECAYDRNNSRLCDQFHKKLSNNSTISQLMRETHTERRNRIGDSGEKISSLLSTYPFFTRNQWVSD